MAQFVGGMPDELIKMFEALEVNTEKMLAEMVTAGAQTALDNVNAKMPKDLKRALNGNNLKVTRAYKTPSDDGVNCQVMITGYFVNDRHIVTPAPLVANLFEYGRSTPDYPKKPFLRSSFNKKQIETAMLKVQDKYIKNDTDG